MNIVQQEDHDIQEALNMSFVNEEPSDELLRNLRVLAQKTVPARRLVWRPTLAVAGAFTVVAAGIGLSLMPTKATAKTFQSLVEAADHVKGFQFSIKSSEDSKQSKFSITGAGGDFVMRTDEGALMEFSADSFKIYDPSQNTVTRFKLGGMIDAKFIAEQVQHGISEGFKEMDLKKMLREDQAKYGKEHTKISPITRENGKDVYHVTMHDPNKPGRVEMIVDAKTDLPDRILVEDNDSDGSQHHTADIEMKFGDIDSSTLKARFPAGAKEVDFDINAIVNGALKGIDGFGPMMEKLAPEMKDKISKLKKDHFKGGE